MFTYRHIQVALSFLVLLLMLVAPSTPHAQKWFSKNKPATKKTTKKPAKRSTKSVADTGAVGVKVLKKLLPSALPKGCALKKYPKKLYPYESKGNPHISSDSRFRDVFARSMVPLYRQVLASMFATYEQNGKELGVFAFYYTAKDAKQSVQELSRIMKPNWGTKILSNKHILAMVWASNKSTTPCYLFLQKHTQQMLQK